MIKSKKVKEGSLVNIRGGKVILSGRRSIPRGIWTEGSSRILLTDNGRVKVDSPEGIIVWGNCYIKGGAT